jgi:hypothetical protein
MRVHRPAPAAGLARRPWRPAVVRRDERDPLAKLDSETIVCPLPGRKFLHGVKESSRAESKIVVVKKVHCPRVNKTVARAVMGPDLSTSDFGIPGAPDPVNIASFGCRHAFAGVAFWLAQLGCVPARVENVVDSFDDAGPQPSMSVLCGRGG